MCLFTCTCKPPDVVDELLQSSRHGSFVGRADTEDQTDTIRRVRNFGADLILHPSLAARIGAEEMQWISFLQITHAVRIYCTERMNSRRGRSNVLCFELCCLLPRLWLKLETVQHSIIFSLELFIFYANSHFDFTLYLICNGDDWI